MISRPLGNTLPARALGALYGGVVAARNLLYDRLPLLSRTAPLPVVSVGGVHAGGSGKTPLVSLIARDLLDRGARVVVLSRGYARRESRAVVVAPSEPAPWALVGDEPAMMRREMQGLWLGIGADRYANACRVAARATGQGPVVALLDDGFQHRHLRRDLDIVCLPADPWNGHLLPAGYLRESLRGIRRADAVCIVGDDSQLERMTADAGLVSGQYGVREVFVLVQRPDGWVEAISGTRSATLPITRPALLCGIARPERFVRAVRRVGVEPVRNLLLPDHHRWTISEVSGALAKPADGVVTTAKDAARMVSLQLANQTSIWYLTIRLRFADVRQEERFRGILHTRTHA